VSFSNPRVATLISEAFVPVRFSIRLIGPGSDDAGRKFALESRNPETDPLHPPDTFIISPERIILGTIPYNASEEKTLELLDSILDQNTDFAFANDPRKLFLPDANDAAQTSLASLESRWDQGERASMIDAIVVWLEKYGGEWEHGDAVARTLLGAARYHNGDFDGADKEWSDVIERHPNHPLRHRATYHMLDQSAWVRKHHPDIKDARHPKPGEKRIVDPFPETRIQNRDMVFSSSEYRVSPSGIPFALVPAGTFTMGGDPPKFERELPLRRVTISRDFWVSAWPVTLGDWRGFRPNDVFDSKDGRVNLLPVNSVTFRAAAEYCEFISSLDGISYRLLTEAEWEYSARANIEGAEYPWGDEPPDKSKCNYLFPQGVPVASYPPNGFGLFDMAGNCRQWTSDVYFEDAYKLTPAEVTDPKFSAEVNGESGHFEQARVVRGGYSGVEYSKFLVRNANRISTSHAGFRLVAEF
jgi:formylglycine-generating enzyme required for sulfatase activity